MVGGRGRCGGWVGSGGYYDTHVCVLLHLGPTCTHAIPLITQQVITTIECHLRSTSLIFRGP